MCSKNEMVRAKVDYNRKVEADPISIISIPLPVS